MLKVPQLTGTPMKELCYTFGIAKIMTTPYRPQSNGIVEQIHGTLVPMLWKTMANKLDWVKQVPLALHTMRLAPHTDTGVLPFKFVHVYSPLDLGKWRSETARSLLAKSKWTTSTEPFLFLWSCAIQNV